MQNTSGKRIINAGVVGAGIAGEVHLHAYAQHPSVHLKTVCDLDEKRRSEVEQNFGAATCTDYRQLADDPEIEVVSVITPDPLHCEIVTTLLESGKHVIVAKPLATKTDEARRMVQAARAADRHLMVDFHTRWNPPIVEAKRRVDMGQLGTPLMASARLANTLYVPRQMLSWAGKSGPHWFLFPHIMDLACWMFNRQGRRVTAYGHKGILQEMGIDAYDTIQALVEFDDCSATFETSWTIPETFPRVVDFQMTLFGSNGRIGLTPHGPTLDVASDGKFEWPASGVQHDIHGRLEGWKLWPIIHFIDCLLEGRTPLCLPEDAFHNTALICAVEASIASGQKVEVETL